MTPENKAYLEKKENESLRIMENTTNDKKYYSASRQLDFCRKQLGKATFILLLLFTSFANAQFITVPEDDINTQFGIFIDPTLTDSGAQIGAFATMVMNWGYAEASISIYDDADVERIAYTDLVAELGLNGHFGGYEPIRAYAGFRIGFINRDNKNTYPMAGGSIGFDWRVSARWSKVGVYVGAKLWTDYREDQKDEFFGSAKKYKRGFITNNPLLQENGALRVSFSF